MDHPNLIGAQGTIYIVKVLEGISPVIGPAILAPGWREVQNDNFSLVQIAVQMVLLDIDVKKVEIRTDGNIWKLAS